ncbi:MAG: hypothetical protein WBB98_13310 [Xanthobacteraceae bacterium]
MISAPDFEPDKLATTTSLDATMALAEWQSEKRAFEAQLADVDAIMSEPQQVAT